jgi:4'-phosphopantetheinyl transferase
MASNEVHIWFDSLDVSRQILAERYAVLNGEERARARRYGHDKVRERFVAGRGWLRCLLASYLGCEPGDVEFGTGPHGKPFLVDDAGSGLSFNLAHSGGMAVCAIGWDRRVGVDIEEIRPDRATDELAKRFFAAGEWQALAALPARERVVAFFRCWSRKEAFIKAIGEGLSFPLEAFEVSLGPGEPPALLTIRGDTEAARHWSLHELPAPAGYVSALAVDGPAPVVLQPSTN